MNSDPLLSSIRADVMSRTMVFLEHGVFISTVILPGIDEGFSKE